MATTEIIHEHGAATSDNSGSGIIVGVVLLILFVLVMLYVFGSGALRGIGGSTNVQVPDHMNVNVQGTGK